MVASLADLRFLLMILLLCGGIGDGACSQEAPRVLGLRLEDPEGRVYMKERIISAPQGASFKLRLFGSDLNGTWPWVAFAGARLGEAGAVGDAADPCGQETRRDTSAFQVTGEVTADEEYSGLIEVKVRDKSIMSLTAGDDANPTYHLCVLKSGSWVSVGRDRLRINNENGLPADYIPPWGVAVLIVLLILVCGVLRTVNLSLLWLDPLELYVLHSCGSEEDKRAAKRLEPIRRRGNFLVCSLLFLCALGHSVLGVLLYRALGSIAPAVFTSGFLIFLVSELVPHIVCSGYGFQLAPGLTWLAQVCMVLTCPLSCPLGLVLDLALRRDISTCGVRERAMEMIRTNVNDPYRSNIVEILYVKDLALVDPDDCTPMTTITKFYNHPLHFVFNDTKLDAMLEEFKKGNSALAIVQKVNNEGEGDPFYEVLGLVTLEDVIEEIIKSEILDESDGYIDMKVKRPLAPLEISLEPRSVHEEFSLFKLPEGEPKIRTSPQLLLATHRFLSREVEHFSPARVSEKVLFHLLRHPSVNQEVHFDPSNRLSPDHYLYTRNHPVDYFILLLQGRVEVEIGKEGLKFENGAFTYYGVSALRAPTSVHQSPVSTQRHSPRDPFELGDATSSSSYCPDYTVRALTDLQLIRVTRMQYLNALMASRVGQSPDPSEIKILPNSQTKLLNDRNITTQGGSKSQESSTEEEAHG
ncbi:metal transporter CNNM3 isoform X3 [Salvelinus fontinalis]|uniref:metal transporter CNNM3 isoform X3 n=1 Tax=Salvelinus fontinalis TaxID=8038 RepID=UPI002484FBDB|nr:metal transporter CNNM3 isoform X3 [Salvelinus fontinalis]